MRRGTIKERIRREILAIKGRITVEELLARLVERESEEDARTS